MPRVSESLIASAVARLERRPGHDNSVTFAFGGGYWVQVLKGGPTSDGDFSGANPLNRGYYAEVVCNTYLPDDLRLSDAKVDALLALGWDTPDYDDGNYQRWWADGAETALARDVLEAMTTVYGLPSDGEVDVTFDDIFAHH